MATEDLSLQVLAALRRQGGALAARELQQMLGVSQPTVSRALAPLIQSGQVRKVGAARTQRYVLPRQVAGVGAEVAIMRVDTEGHASPFGRMIALHGGGFWVDEADGLSEQHDGLPWFLRSEEHTSELQSPCNLVCRLLLEKKKKSPLLPFQSGPASHPLL